LATTLEFPTPEIALDFKLPQSQCSKGFSQDAKCRLYLGDLGKIILGFATFCGWRFSAFRKALNLTSAELTGPSSINELSASRYLLRRAPL
jgi:hypothetical protein